MVNENVSLKNENGPRLMTKQIIVKRNQYLIHGFIRTSLSFNLLIEMGLSYFWSL